MLNATKKAKTNREVPINSSGRKLLLLFLLLLSRFCFAQNLVPNPSFEDTVACPSNSGQINNAVGWSSYRVTPDYFNTCADSSSFVSIPWNFCGYHYPRTGNAYAGFIIGLFNAREYIGIQLSQLLNMGQQYYVSFYVCRGGNINRNRASNKIGIHLSTIPYSSPSPAPISNISQVYTDSVITDTVNWTRISGSFVADSAYQFLSIGNFFNDSLTTYIAFDSIHYQCYYYLEDVILSPEPDCCEGINQAHTSDLIKVFPNPTSDWIEIEGSNISKLNFYNVLGEICYTNDIPSASPRRVNVSNLRKGVYTLKIQTSKH
ncbi:MAG: T9SS type A sorting domain-containing protein, partial [Bacteroidia bacterium]|nr:T9SS type A sorting domain-containing protein [Bacteroidia bacterium]